MKHSTSNSSTVLGNTKRGYCSAWRYVLLLFGLLIFVAAISVLALEGGEWRYDSQEYLAYEIYETYETYETYDAYAHDYDYQYSYTDYMNEAPYYNYHEHPPSTTQAPTFDGSISIEVDDQGRIDMYPPGINSDATFTYNYLLITFPVHIYPGELALTLPYGWTYGVSHGIAGYDEGYHPYTLVSIRHNFNNYSGYIGFAPFAFGIPPGYTPILNVSTVPDLVAALTDPPAGPGTENRVVAISADIETAGNITITTGLNIVLVSQGTNLNGDLELAPGAPSQVFAINRVSGGGRHISFNAGVTLTLAHIVLDGHNHLGPEASRGGISLAGDLYMLAGSVVTRCRSHGAAGAGVHVVTADGSFTMRGGEISYNRSDSVAGAGVNIQNGATFNMHGGEIRGNRAETDAPITSARGGAGVRIAGGDAMFVMRGGVICSNITSEFGGGVWIGMNATVQMFDGAIRHNQANRAGPVVSGGGGGVFLEANIANPSASFDMFGGEMYGNFARGAGGGIATRGYVTLWGGIIHNNTSEGVDDGLVNTQLYGRGGGGGVWVGNLGTLIMDNGPENPYPP
ncbi:MAG: hypothetical protein FWC92_11980, partial [Defluviitaleaceae bacterium]|nr:hypothetical protein [Defluviitaleaceae bacterium]